MERFPFLVVFQLEKTVLNLFKFTLWIFTCLIDKASWLKISAMD